MACCTFDFKLLLLCNDSGHDGRASSTFFVGGFVFGGLIMGALGCVYAPQVTAYLCYMLLFFVVAFSLVCNLLVCGGSIAWELCVRFLLPPLNFSSCNPFGKSRA